MVNTKLLYFLLFLPAIIFMIGEFIDDRLKYRVTVNVIQLKPTTTQDNYYYTNEGKTNAYTI